MLRALAKRPADRYARAQDLATAFRLALAVTDAQAEHAQQHETASSSSVISTSFHSPQGFFDPKGPLPAATSEQVASISSHTVSTAAPASSPSLGGFASFKKTALRSERARVSEQVTISMPVTNPTTPLQDLHLILAVDTHPSAALALPAAEQEITGAVTTPGPAPLNSGTKSRSDFRIKHQITPIRSTLHKPPILPTPP